MNLPTKLPKELYHMFWDVDPLKINPSKKPYFVIQRLLDRGGTREIRWVEKNMGDDLIKETFAQVRDFTPSIGNFWSRILKIPKNKMLCLQPSYLKIRRSVWPY